MDYKKIFETVDSLAEEYVKVLADACYIESPTACKERVDECGRFFIELAREQGWKIEVQHDDSAGDPICITMNPDSPLAPICLSGHIDTVHPVGHFKEPRVRIEGNCLYGPGALDCKGGVVASLLAMRAQGVRIYRTPDKADNPDRRGDGKPHERQENHRLYAPTRTRCRCVSQHRGKRPGVVGA